MNCDVFVFIVLIPLLSFIVYFDSKVERDWNSIPFETGYCCLRVFILNSFQRYECFCVVELFILFLREKKSFMLIDFLCKLFHKLIIGTIKKIGLIFATNFIKEEQAF